MSLVFGELRRVSAHHMRGAGPEHALRTIALMHGVPPIKLLAQKHLQGRVDTEGATDGALLALNQDHSATGNSILTQRQSSSCGCSVEETAAREGLRGR
jgi:hypothetical protein